MSAITSKLNMSYCSFHKCRKTIHKQEKNKMKKVLLSLFTVCLFAMSLTAQMTEGVVTMEVTEATSDDQQMAMQLGMLKGATTTIYFTDKQSLTSMDIMGGMMVSKSYSNAANNTMDIMIDAMGNKVWVSSPLDEAKKLQQKEGVDNAEVTYHKEETKEIMGYKAHKVTVTMPETQAGMSITGYVTDEIKTDATVINGAEGLNIDGFPLEFTVVTPQMTVTIAATDIKKEVDAAVFAPNTEGYQKMTMEQFTQSLGGMSGGLGF